MTLREKLPPAWKAFWQARQAREKRALKLMLVIVGVALAAQLLWSLDSERRKLRDQLPRLAGQAATMAQIKQEWLTLSAPGASATAPDPALLRDSVNQRLAQLGPGIAAQWAGDGTLRLSGQTRFADWVSWLAAVQGAERMFVVSATVHADSAGIRVEAELAPVR